MASSVTRGVKSYRKLKAVKVPHINWIEEEKRLNEAVARLDPYSQNYLNKQTRAIQSRRKARGV